MLLERDDALGDVRAAFEEVRRTGRGRFVIVGGEAGGGKTVTFSAPSADGGPAVLDLRKG